MAIPDDLYVGCGYWVDIADEASGGIEKGFKHMLSTKCQVVKTPKKRDGSPVLDSANASTYALVPTSHHGQQSTP